MKKRLRQITALLVGFCLVFGAKDPLLLHAAAPKTESSLREGFVLFYNGENKLPTALCTLSTPVGELQGYRLFLPSAFGAAGEYDPFAPVELKTYDALCLPVRWRLNVILKHSYPHMQLGELRSFCGADDLCLAEAICVSQALIWKYTSSIEINTAKLTLNARKYYHALEALPSLRFPAEEGPLLQVQSSVGQAPSGEMSFRILCTPGVEGGVLCHRYDRELSSLGAKERVYRRGNTTVLEVEGLPPGQRVAVCLSLSCTLSARSYVIPGEHEEDALVSYAPMPYGEEKTLVLCGGAGCSALSRFVQSRQSDGVLEK